MARREVRRYTEMDCCVQSLLDELVTSWADGKRDNSMAEPLRTVQALAPETDNMIGSLKRDSRGPVAEVGVSSCTL